MKRERVNNYNVPKLVLKLATVAGSIAMLSGCSRPDVNATASGGPGATVPETTSEPEVIEVLGEIDIETLPEPEVIKVEGEVDIETSEIFELDGDVACETPENLIPEPMGEVRVDCETCEETCDKKVDKGSEKLTEEETSETEETEETDETEETGETDETKETDEIEEATKEDDLEVEDIEVMGIVPVAKE